MSLGVVSLGAERWLGPAVVLAVVGLVVLIWSYRRSHSPLTVKIAAAGLKAAAIIALAICLVEPLFTGNRPRPGSNLFLIVADNSRSLHLTDQGSQATRGEIMKERLAESARWLARLGQDFDVRRYGFDHALKSFKTFDELTLDGEASAIKAALTTLADRFEGQPVAGVLLLTDGNSTDGLPDATALQGSGRFPFPIYPVALGEKQGLVDLSIARINVSQTNFEAAPVTIAAELAGLGIGDRKVVVRVIDETGKELERQTVDNVADGQPRAVRFLLRPEQPGVNFYTVQASLEGEEQAEARPGSSDEATLANNRRIATVNRGGGPYRVLYVSGRPNWEFKFLRRAMEEDDEVDLVGLVRIAKREPKFAYLGRSGERTNPLFRGFGNQEDEQAEQYDQPVLIRLGTENKEELAGGFPKSMEELFRFHAIVFDDIEAEFFTQDQLSLLQQFVSQRGGGFVMLGGPSSFADGKYQRTAIGEMLPIYLDRTPPPQTENGYRLRLTREGWLQPWIRVRSNETDEEKRLNEMPGFRTLNPVEFIKPGASVLAQVETSDGNSRPALVVQSFGRGRTAALLVGDLWRWGLGRAEKTESDLEKSWRQTIRWLIADVPQRVEVNVEHLESTSQSGVRLVVHARDEKFAALDNATVQLRIKTPDKREIELTPESSDQQPGQYVASFAPRMPGAYRASVRVMAPDGSEVGSRETGWSVEPQTEEFRTLTVNRSGLERIAADSDGELLDIEGLETFVASLPNRKIPIVETWTYPLWHQWPVFLFAVACLVGEWGLRRWKGLP